MGFGRGCSRVHSFGKHVSNTSYVPDIAQSSEDPKQRRPRPWPLKTYITMVRRLLISTRGFLLDMSSIFALVWPPWPHRLCPAQRTWRDWRPPELCVAQPHVVALLAHIFFTSNTFHCDFAFRLLPDASLI